MIGLLVSCLHHTQSQNDMTWNNCSSLPLIPISLLMAASSSFPDRGEWWEVPANNNTDKPQHATEDCSCHDTKCNIFIDTLNSRQIKCQIKYLGEVGGECKWLTVIVEVGNMQPLLDFSSQQLAWPMVRGDGSCTPVTSEGPPWVPHPCDRACGCTRAITFSYALLNIDYCLATAQGDKPLRLMEATH